MEMSNNNPIDLNKVTCKRCGHTWIPRQAVIFVCPKCKSPKWDIDKVEKPS
jgi:Zn finger protein HypA/HybF involved in hydrogenase expression